MAQETIMSQKTTMTAEQSEKLDTLTKYFMELLFSKELKDIHDPDGKFFEAWRNSIQQIPNSICRRNHSLAERATYTPSPYAKKKVVYDSKTRTIFDNAVIQRDQINECGVAEIALAWQGDLDQRYPQKKDNS